MIRDVFTCQVVMGLLLKSVKQYKNQSRGHRALFPTA